MAHRGDSIFDSRTTLPFIQILQSLLSVIITVTTDEPRSSLVHAGSCFVLFFFLVFRRGSKKTSQESSRDNRGHKTHPRIHPIPPHGSSPLHCSLLAPSQQLAVEDFPRKQRRETLGRTSNVNKVKLNQQTQLVLLCRSESDYKLPHTHTESVGGSNGK